MVVRDIGVSALDSQCEVAGHEKVEDAIDAVGGNPPSVCRTDLSGNIIGANGPTKSRKGREHLRAHFGPLFARSRQCLARGVSKRWRVVLEMRVL